MAGMRSRQRMFAAVMRLLLKCLRLGRRRRFKLVRQAEQLWQYGHLCLHSLLYNSFTNGDVVLDSLFEPVYWLVDHVTRWFGVVFVALVIGLTSSIVAIVYICLLPLILQTYTPAWICWHLAYGHWNLIMIVFHYYMAITTSPGHPPQAKDDLTGVSICRKCIAPKPARTHHCSICNRHTTRPHHPRSPSTSELSTRAWSTSGSCAESPTACPERQPQHLAVVAPGKEGLCATHCPFCPQLGCVSPGRPHAVARCPHHPWGNQHRAAHQQEGEAETAEERQGLQEPLQLRWLG
ncbi:palmitoyltransferase ZDHHC16 isoform 8-T9 [Alca torda]